MILRHELWNERTCRLTEYGNYLEDDVDIVIIYWWLSTGDKPVILGLTDGLHCWSCFYVTWSLRNAQHVLRPYLEERPQPHYNLRNRLGINKTLI